MKNVVESLNLWEKDSVIHLLPFNLSNKGIKLDIDYWGSFDSSGLIVAKETLFKTSGCCRFFCLEMLVVFFNLTVSWFKTWPSFLKTEHTTIE